MINYQAKEIGKIVLGIQELKGRYDLDSQHPFVINDNKMILAAEH